MNVGPDCPDLHSDKSLFTKLSDECLGMGIYDRSQKDQDKVFGLKVTDKMSINLFLGVK